MCQHCEVNDLKAIVVKLDIHGAGDRRRMRFLGWASGVAASLPLGGHGHSGGAI